MYSIIQDYMRLMRIPGIWVGGKINEKITIPDILKNKFLHVVK
jgi:hypothetical protein